MSVAAAGMAPKGSNRPRSVSIEPACRAVVRNPVAALSYYLPGDYDVRSGTAEALTLESRMTDRQISLAHLTVPDTTPPELVTVAAAAGLRTIGIRLTATPRVGIRTPGLISEARTG